MRHLAICEYMNPFIAIIAQRSVPTYKISQAGRQAGGGAGHFFFKRHHCNGSELTYR